MIGAVKLRDEVVTVMNLYTLNAIISNQIFLNYTCKRHTDRKTLEFIRVIGVLSYCHIK